MVSLRWYFFGRLPKGLCTRKPLHKLPRRVKAYFAVAPTLAIALGSGFHHVRTAKHVDRKVSGAKIPGSPVPGVRVHSGELIFGRFDGVPALVPGGRAHLYEGCLLEQVTLPIRTLAALAIRDLLLTNAAGIINK
jgi:purine-nucleoside phosphorylase